MAKTTDPTFRPSEDDQRFYQQHGYFFAPKIFSDEELDRVIEAQDRLYRGVHDPWPFKKVPFIGWKQGHDPSLRKNDYASVIVPELRELITKPVLGEVARVLCGETVRLWQDQLSYKAPLDANSKTVMGWHNDRQYWGACRSESMLTAWIPLVDMEIEMGPITFLDESHLWSKVEGMDFFSTDLKKLEEEIEKRGHDLKKVPAVLKRGQVSFHHCKTLHGSGPNISPNPRRALAVHLQPVSNIPVENQFHIAKLLLSEMEDRSFSNPRLFPILGERK